MCSYRTIKSIFFLSLSEKVAFASIELFTLSQLSPKVICHTEMAAWSFRGLPPNMSSKSGIGTSIVSSVSFSECSLSLFPCTNWFSKVRQFPYVLVLFKLTCRFCSSMSSSGCCFKGLEGKHLFLKGLNVLSLLFDMESSLLLVLFGGLGWNLGPRPTQRW